MIGSVPSAGPSPDIEGSANAEVVRDELALLTVEVEALSSAEPEELIRR